MDIHRNKIESFHKNLSGKNYKILDYSRNESYNCIAYSMGITNKWIWTNEIWPEGLSRYYCLDSFIKMYNYYGYFKCDNSLYEIEYNKICIYIDKENNPTHAAKQINNVWWESKLGPQYIIRHKLEWLEGNDDLFNDYGFASIFMKKRI